jgi:hypothetical protein
VLRAALTQARHRTGAAAVLWESVVALEPLSPQSRQQPWQPLPGGKQEPVSKISRSAFAKSPVEAASPHYADQIKNKLRAITRRPNSPLGVKQSGDLQSKELPFRSRTREGLLIQTGCSVASAFRKRTYLRTNCASPADSARKIIFAVPVCFNNKSPLAVEAALFAGRSQPIIIGDTLAVRGISSSGWKWSSPDTEQLRSKSSAGRG